MNKVEFLLKTPDIIEHPAHGYGELEIVMDKPKEKGACYRHRNKSASYGTYAETWQEIYDRLLELIAEDKNM